LKDRERGKEPSKFVAAIATLSPAVVARRLRDEMEAECSNSFQDCRSVIVASVVIPHLEEIVHQIAHLVVAVLVQGVPFYNVERVDPIPASRALGMA
jgi:hypothetical protein